MAIDVIVLSKRPLLVLMCSEAAGLRSTIPTLQLHSLLSSAGAAFLKVEVAKLPEYCAGQCSAVLQKT